MRATGHRIRLTANHLIRAGIPERFWGVRISHVSPRVRDRLDAYLRHLSDMLAGGEGLHLHGPNGTGKTSIAVLVAMEALRLGSTVLFTTAEQLRKASFDEIWFDADQTFMDRAQDVDLLVIDDLGKEHPGGGYAERLLEDILRRRSARRKTTVFTTNVPVGSADQKSGLFGLYSKSMLEVSRESVRPLQVTGDNLRQTVGSLNL